MRFSFLTLACLAGLVFASEPRCENRRCSDGLSATVARKESVLAATGKSTPNEVKAAGPVTPESARKRDDRRPPAGKPCRPAYLFM
jgi:hypothetical protein